MNVGTRGILYVATHQRSPPFREERMRVSCQIVQIAPYDAGLDYERAGRKRRANNVGIRERGTRRDRTEISDDATKDENSLRSAAV